MMRQKNQTTTEGTILWVKIWLMAVVLSGAGLASFAQADSFAQSPLRNEIIEKGQFIQIPGPNPILKPGPEGAWDDKVTEASDAFRDVGTYYFYYHACGSGKGYRLGVATADHPLGPFKKYGDKPVLDLGPKGSWDDRHVACAMVFKEDDEKYYMWYSGLGTASKGWSVGLATAEHPLGPWKKYKGNPILDNFGYVGGMCKVKGKYHLYVAHPISWKKYDYKGDYSPLALALADKPEGPWTKYAGNPLMIKGEREDWDDGGISEAEVLYHNGAFHMFYGGTERYGPRLEHIGYAYSLDGFNFVKYGRNPVAVRNANPNAAAFAEVHAIIEPPFIYIYHTLRYTHKDNDDYPWIEDLGVQVLATQTPFSIDMSVLDLPTLAPQTTTALEDSPPICLSHINRFALTAECSYSSNAKKPIRIHVRASYDGVKYDTADLYTLVSVLQPGQKARRTFPLESKVRFVKVLVENADASESVSELRITAHLGS